jgi:Ca-activated chloride channel family protein
MQVLVRQQNKPETLNVQSLSQSEIYLTGYYQLEVLSLPRLLIDSVLVSQNHITNVDIPAPGILVIKKPGLGYGSILKHNKEGLEWVYTLRNDVNHIESMYLLPGNYQVVFRTKFSNSTASSIKKSFEIKSGSTLTLDLTKL